MIAHSGRVQIFKYSISGLGYFSPHSILTTVKVLNLNLESLKFSFMVDLNLILEGENHGR